MATRSVFISYARTDRDDVHEAAELLRAGGVKVFLDVMHIEFGERWKEALYKALFRCERVMVFWSQSAAASEWVEREWRYALELGKKIVPTLLDLTPLPSELAEFQAVRRLRAFAVTTPLAAAANRSAGTLPPQPPLRRRATASVFAATAFLGCAAVAGYVLLSKSRAPAEVALLPAPAPEQAQAPKTSPTPSPGSSAPQAPGLASSGASAAEVLAAQRRLREQLDAAVRAHQRDLARLSDQAASPERDARVRAIEQRLAEERLRWALADKQLSETYDPRQPPRPAQLPAPPPEPGSAFQGLVTQHRFALAVLAAMAVALCVRIFSLRRSAPPNAKKFVHEVFSA